jgi:hypothetical protein
MALWMMMFSLGLIGLAGTSAKLKLAKRQGVKSALFVIEDADGNTKYVISPR